MSLDNFLVRPHRRYVEKYSSGEAWAKSMQMRGMS